MTIKKTGRNLALILAAGAGKRMGSPLAKVLQPLAGLSLLGHVLTRLNKQEALDIAVISNPAYPEIAAEVKKHCPKAFIFYQDQPLGTAHAVMCAQALFSRQNYEHIFIFYGDSPLIDEEIFSQFNQSFAQGAHVVIAGFHSANPFGYGRIIEKNGELVSIIEERDASATEKQINFCNAGFLAIDAGLLWPLLKEIDNNNEQKEFYLTDIIKGARARQYKINIIEIKEESALGANDAEQLALLADIWQRQRRRYFLKQAVFLQAPEHIYFSHDTKIGRGCVIEPYVYFGPNVTLEENVHIHSFSYIEGSHIKKGSHIGPFARLRPGSMLGEGVKIGNFCEIKESQIADRAKVNHLTYIGDALIGEEANIGAGTITCNYDGMNKWPTDIGPKAFIGSNSSLVAPVKIGANAYIASGSVVTEDVPAEALAIARSKQYNKEGYSLKIKAKQARQAKNKKS